MRNIVRYSRVRHSALSESKISDALKPQGVRIKRCLAVRHPPTYARLKTRPIRHWQRATKYYMNRG